jgi:TatA/E family protein of Tat protein translocase
MFGLGIGEVLVVLVIALIFIGPKKLPELAKGLGKGFREFQGAMRGINQTFQNPLDPNTQDNHQDRVPYDQQFRDDPPHDQNKPSDEVYETSDKASQSADTEVKESKLEKVDTAGSKSESESTTSEEVKVTQSNDQKEN